MITQVFVERFCSHCGEIFKTSNNSEICYNCHLEEICGGFPPEEGDFNTASLLSGRMSEAELQEFQRELAAVEEGRSIQNYPVDDKELDDWDDPAWCYECNNDIAFCECQPESGGCPDCGYKVESCCC